MANIKFVPASKGFVEVMNFAGVQNMLDEKATAVRDQANSMLSDEGYTSTTGHVKVDSKWKDGRKAKGVYTRTLHAQRSQNKNKTLTKALGSASKG